MLHENKEEAVFKLMDEVLQGVAQPLRKVLLLCLVYLQEHLYPKTNSCTFESGGCVRIIITMYVRVGKSRERKQSKYWRQENGLINHGCCCFFSINILLLESNPVVYNYVSRTI